MERYSQKQLKSMVSNGVAIDITYSTREAVREPYTQIGYSAGLYGCNGMLLKGQSEH